MEKYFSSRLAALVWDVVIRLVFFVILGYQSLQLYEVRTVLNAERTEYGSFRDSHIAELLKIQELISDRYAILSRDTRILEHYADECREWRKTHLQYHELYLKPQKK